MPGPYPPSMRPAPPDRVSCDQPVQTLRAKLLSGYPWVVSKDRLSDYRGKRDTDASGEPAGGRRAGGDGPVFVVQRHDASRLHFDFRLEVDGVLPRGQSRRGRRWTRGTSGWPSGSRTTRSTTRTSRDASVRGTAKGR